VRILVVNFDPESAAVLVSDLDDLGHEVYYLDGAPSDSTPDVVVACLDEPSPRVVDTVVELSENGLYRPVPLLFTGTDEHALAAARERFPRANFARRDMLGPALASMDA
jgi:hypothetical protein